MPNELAQQIFGTPGAMALSVLAILGLLLLAAAWSDLRTQRIPNRLVLAGLLLALLLHTVLPAGNGFLSVIPGALGLLGALQGLVLAFLATFPLYWFRVMGAGDVKLIAMAGAFLGPVDIWWALLFTLFAGGVLAVAMILRRSVLGNVLQNLRLMLWEFPFTTVAPGNNKPEAVAGPVFVSAATLPYGVAIAAGCIAAVLYRARLFGLL